MTLAKAKAKTNETFIVQASLTIVTCDHKNMFIVQATGPMPPSNVYSGNSNCAESSFFFVATPPKSG
jgi:hypothetical protein